MLRELLVLVLDLMYLALSWFLFMAITAWLNRNNNLGAFKPTKEGFSAAYWGAEQTGRILDVVTLGGVLFLHICSYLVAIRPEIMDEY